MVIAAPASGSGKTTVATGLMGALRRAGHAVAPFKVGPDYIDPGYHSLATGKPGRNLDSVLVGSELVGPLFRHGAHGADIAVVEGVMGLFDGRITDEKGSTAEIAGLLNAPVVLVVDVKGHSQSLAALLHGFVVYAAEAGIRIAGVILNRVGSARHRAILTAAADRAGLSVLGALPRTEKLSVPSRHLGLVTAIEHGQAALDAVDAMTHLVAEHVDLPAIVAAARSDVATVAWDPVDVVGAPVAGEPVVALAAGHAFTFGYAEHRELLAAAGAVVAEFDPRRDALPDETSALVLPGGFPEQFATDLSSNEPLRQQVRDMSGPIHAECAGLTYLCNDLDGAPMCGVIDAQARFTDSLTLGYREAVSITGSTLFDEGERLSGHEFHRTTVDYRDDTRQPAWAWSAVGGIRREGVVAGEGRIHASYLHTHPAANPSAVARFVSRAAT
ncbi:cobyrinate a,c-diamide synthase [Mycobacteroides chelonae]|uniref:Hydrogenobyrinate a,c-diamide synthase n=1 Tax=Mycobacteroides chelonae TaxID=1774 RepID=A0AB73MZA3_MYCCH|nr:cobyrinate a,c-diamide synthase [Mycobacteroides chelonae]MBF9326384.1 cobyrinate a,c-diamide synthase [Mycobacteroides chelonae]MBF9420560.1 cobyrinate a,c-diamide synthase [Mycobacteroides chelonae]MBF9438779.1 cobyrinate a,c-diamide synthase [Mycobacteroides chelonae]MBV6360339.1 cobyrinate a,c-diamide synthase [Mycobacteroides chelonae]MEC4834074.1 cobyrinate a,c-diamide synthase [Mycobacteroides chelonae]